MLWRLSRCHILYERYMVWMKYPNANKYQILNQALLFFFFCFFQIIMNEFTFQSQTAHSTYLELERKNSSEDEPCRDQEVEWAERCHVARHTPLHPPPSFSSLSLHTLTHTTNDMKCSFTSKSLCYWLRFFYFFQSLSLFFLGGVQIGLKKLPWLKMWGTQVWRPTYTSI